MKKILSITLCLALILTSMTFNVQAETNDNKVLLMEKELDKTENQINEKYKNMLKNASDVEKHKLEQQKLNELEESKIKILNSYGFKIVEQNEGMSPMSLSSDIDWTSEALTYNTSTGIYRYQIDWTFNGGDTYYDIEDVVGVGITNPDSYYIYSSFAKTWDIAGVQTGYVDEYGNDSREGSLLASRVTKRFEDKNGVAFNIYDVFEDDYSIFATAKGRITIYIGKNNGVIGTPTNKIITTYNHNYKTLAINASAQISVAKFTEATLSISYSKVNKQWLTSSGGKIIK